MRTSEYMLTTNYMHALSDETRLRCFRILAISKTSLCVAELVDILLKPQYAISRSLSELRKAGLVHEERQGKLVFYKLSDDNAIQALGEWFLRYCNCGHQTQAPGKNPDGSTLPGADGCEYDNERLHWRLELRDQTRVMHTYRAENDPKDERKRVLIVCVHNSARSQLAEEYLRAFAPDQFMVESAGLTPGTLNPLVVQVLAEDGIDISGKELLSVKDKYRAGHTYQWVITVCSREAEQDCPIFPGPVRRLSWPFPDPTEFRGSDSEKLAQVRELAAQIKLQVQEFAAANNKSENRNRI